MGCQSRRKANLRTKQTRSSKWSTDQGSKASLALLSMWRVLRESLPRFKPIRRRSRPSWQMPDRQASLTSSVSLLSTWIRTKSSQIQLSTDRTSSLWSTLATLAIHREMPQRIQLQSTLPNQVRFSIISSRQARLAPNRWARTRSMLGSATTNAWMPQSSGLHLPTHRNSRRPVASRDKVSAYALFEFYYCTFQIRFEYICSCLRLEQCVEQYNVRCNCRP